MMRTLFGRVASENSGEEYTWFRNHDYDPPFLHVMDESDHEVLVAWHNRTAAEWPNSGSSGVEMMSMLSGLIMSSGLTRIVQCGHYVGFSTLVLGFICRKMKSKRFLYTVDLDPEPSAYTQEWVDAASLSDDIKIAVRDSSDAYNVVEAVEHLGGPPELVYIDSSHQYEHTMRELNLWWEALPPGGLIVMDDISQWAAEYDRTGLGGSHRAALEFCQTNAANSVLINGNFGRTTTSPIVYTDVCGFGLLQKPY
jgi:predicted O-methyltransferase YrrM